MTTDASVESEEFTVSSRSRESAALRRAWAHEIEVLGVGPWLRAFSKAWPKLSLVERLRRLHSLLSELAAAVNAVTTATEAGRRVSVLYSETELNRRYFKASHAMASFALEVWIPREQMRIAERSDSPIFEFPPMRVGTEKLSANLAASVVAGTAAMSWPTIDPNDKRHSFPAKRFAFDDVLPNEWIEQLRVAIGIIHLSATSTRLKSGRSSRGSGTPRQLTEMQAYTLRQQRDHGLSTTKIASLLKRDESTVREHLRRAKVNEAKLRKRHSAAKGI